MYINFITFGCKVNSYETAAMAECFTKAGHTVTADKSFADVFVINSCTVTGESDNKLRSTLRRLRREYPNSIIALTGCYPQAFPEEARRERLADIITGTGKRNEIVRLIEEYTKSGHFTFSVPPVSDYDMFENTTVSFHDGHTRAFMKVQDGCSRFCTYCIIPYSRGHIRSRRIEDIIAEAEVLVSRGYKEIVLVGINLAFYGAEFGKRLADAAEAVCSVSGVKRLRLGSIEPEMLTDEDLNRLKALPQFCPSFHLSLQSGCDKTLKAMNRHYTSYEYECLVEKIRRIFPDCSITTDIMTGFPGETEKDHRESAEFVKRIGFSDIHVFPYSRRKGTKAELMKNQIPEEIKKLRSKEMAEIGAELKLKYMQTLIGKETPVLFEREKADGIHHGYAPNYVHIKILTKYSEKSLRKMIFYVKIDKIEDNCCIGHIVRRYE